MKDALSHLIIDSRRLLYFYHVAKTGSFSRAESAVQAPQPVISRHIQKLEEELGTQLLARNGRGVELTQTGEVLFERAEPILRAMEETVALVERSKRSPTALIRIAAPATMMTLYMPEAVRRTRAGVPDVEFIIMQALTGEIYDKLIGGRIDVGVVQEVINPSKYEAVRLLEEPMLAVVSRGHPLAKGKKITREQLAQNSLVLPSHTHGLRNLIDRYFDEASLQIDTPMQIDSIPLIRAIVEEGREVTILPKSTCLLEFDPGKFTLLELDPKFSRTLYICYQKDQPEQSYIRTFINCFQDVVHEKLRAAEKK